MGKCTSSPVRKKPTSHHDREHIDTESFQHQKLPKLCFHANLANVILKKYPYNQATPIFKLGEEQFRLDQKRQAGEDAIKWKIHEKFDFQMTEYELRKNCIDVSISNEKMELVGRVRINLFLITTGPYHQDFAVEFSNGELGRISFDLKISQIISLKIQSIAAEIFLLKNHPGQEFSYSIKTIVNPKDVQVGNNASTAESEPSYPAMVLLERDTNEQLELEDILEKQGLFARKKSQRLSAKKIDVGRNLTWSQDGGVLPSLETKVLASELHNTYFQVLIWKEIGSDEEIKREFFADSYVSFYKLFGTEAETTMRGEEQYESRNINMIEKIEHYGKDYGKGSFSFNIVNQPYFRQYQICVHTELGVLKTAPIFAIEETKTSQKCPELQELLTISQTVQQNVFLLNKLQSEEASPATIREVKMRIESDLEKMFHLLQKTSSPPIFIYKYSSQGELMKGQKILVELGMKITKYFEIEDPDINDIGWLILISLIKRSQFNLSHMGFQQKQKKLIENRLINEPLSEKLKIGSIYKMFLYKLLSLSLNSLNRKGSEYERTFAQIFSAYAYFRIPEFRKEILRLITNEKDPEIIEWRGVQFNLQDDITQKMIQDNANIFSQLFDWQQHFYKWLVRDQQLESEDISLNDILNQQSWKERFTKRGLAFFYFLKYWVTYIESSIPDKKDIQWRYFPGYNRLLKGFFVEMKQRPILKYPDALIESCFKLLVNEKLVNPVIKILLNKVNVYDTSAVLRVIEYLNLIFKSFTTRKKPLPISFNYSYFFKGLKIILESEFAMGVSSALSLIYNHFTLFHIEFRRSLSMYLLGFIFFKLFLNWSHTVRNIFYHLLTYKIYAQAHKNEQRGRLNKFSIADSDILSRYNQLMSLMQSEEQEYNKKKVQQLQNNLDRHYYKKMKVKAYQKFKSNRMDSSSIFNTKAQSEIKNNSQQKSYENIHTETKFNLVNSRRIVLAVEKQHSSQVNIPAKINSHNKENQSISHEQPRKSMKSLDYNDDFDGHLSLFQRIIQQKQFQIQQIEYEKIKYISIYRPKFKQIERAFIECLQQGNNTCPAIKTEIAIDNRQIRPEKIDDW